MDKLTKEAATNVDINNSNFKITHTDIIYKYSISLKKLHILSMNANHDNKLRLWIKIVSIIISVSGKS